MSAPIEGAVERVCRAPTSRRRRTGRTRTSTGASGCPHEELRAGAFPWLQLLVHPEIWVYPGGTMGETMRALLEAESVRRLEQLAADGIDLDGDDGLRPITVLLTACGSPGTAASSARSERTASESCDWSERTCPSELSAGSSATRFHLVPPGDDDRFADAMRELRRARGSTSSLPQSSYDLPVSRPGATTSPAPPSSSPSRDDPPLERQGGLLRAAHRLGVPAARFVRVREPGRATTRHSRSATRTRRSASSRSSRRARADTASSTRPSTARISS